jgi:hypothetical protein
MMRKLYLIPIIHMSADMGSMASTLDDKAAASLTPELWQRHKEIVSAFWDSIGGFIDVLDVNGFKVYQDGLVAGGEEGLRIVREGAAPGSKNYRIIAGLLEKGAVLVQTESLPLVKQEYGYIDRIARAGTPREKEAAGLRYRLARGNLLRSRDEYIARRIGETLAAGETGILFIGAYHDVAGRLAVDIRVGQVKDTGLMREYHRLLTDVRRDARRFRELGEYLAAPVPGVSFENPTATRSLK